MEMSSKALKKQVAGSDYSDKNLAPVVSVEICYPPRSFWDDTTVPADYVMMTTT